MGSKIIRATLLSVVLMLASGAASPVLAQQMWKGYTFISASNHPTYTHLEKLAKEFAQISEGKIQTKVNVGGSLPIPGSSITQAVGEGTLTFAQDLFFTGSVPLGGLTMLPMLVPTHEDFLKAVAILEPYLAAALDKKGITLLATYNFPQQTIWGVSKITSTEDLKGKKIRVGNIPISEFMRKFGAIPVTLATGDVAPALERSTIEGVVTASAGGGRLWGDMLKSNLRIPLNYDLVLIIANKKAFERLPADLQKKFKEAAQKDAVELTKDIASSEDETTQQLKAKGLVVTIPSKESQKAIALQMRDYWDQWAKSTSPEAVQVLAKVRAALGN